MQIELYDMLQVRCELCSFKTAVLESIHPAFKGRLKICSQTCSDTFWQEKLIENEMTGGKEPFRIIAVGSCDRKNDHADATVCGEDSFFISEENWMLGVADGVGGFGGTSSYMASCLMNQVKHLSYEFERDSKGRSRPFQPQELKLLLEKAHANCKEAKLPEGGTTAVIAAVDPVNRMLHALNVGDSGLVVIRKGRVVLQTVPQVHDQDLAPFQLTNLPEANTDTSNDGQLYSFGPLQRGDLLLLASDGVWDNILEDEMKRLVQESRISGIYKRAEADLGRLADSVIQFCKSTKRKPDDITLVLARVYSTNTTNS